MKHGNKHITLLKFLNSLPRKIISCHGQENVPHLVLHDFCHEYCFNLKKVAYLVDNPDFNCVKGIAGLCKHEEKFCSDVSDVWQEQQKYCEYIKESEFNNKVCGFACESLKSKSSEQEAIKDIADKLGFVDSRYLIWPMKHDNNGILLFQAEEGDAELIDEHLEHCVYYLGLCPIN